MKTSRFQSITYSAVALLLLVSTCYSSPLGSPSDIAKRQTTSCVEQPRALCAHTKGRGEFYDHCIEAMFPCGSEGFIMSYALPRFKKLNDELGHVGQELTQYLHLAEVCFQTKLEQLALKTSRERLPNTESCLHFETQAIGIMNGCFREELRTQYLCPLLSKSEQADQSTLHEHLHSVVKAFRIGGRYFNNTVVDLGIPEAVRQCGSSELADSLVSNQLRVKVTWCTLMRAYTAPGYTPPSPPALTEAQLIKQLAQYLNRSTDQFVFSGPDEMDECNQVTDFSYSLISWFADPKDSKLSESLYSTSLSENRTQFHVRFFNLDPSKRELSQCGDGVRQAGEMCDSADLDGCDRSCTVEYGYKCNTDRLSPSKCVYEEVQRIDPHPVICENTSRRGHSTSSSSHSRIQAVPFDTQQQQNTAGSSSALSVRTLSLPLLVLIALVCLLVPSL